MCSVCSVRWRSFDLFRPLDDVNGIPEGEPLFFAHHAEEGDESGGGVVTLRPSVVHQRGRVGGTGGDRLISIGTAFRLATDPALLMEIVQNGHHRGVRDGPFLPKVFQDFSNGDRAVPLPHPRHDRVFEFSQWARHNSAH